MANRNYPQKCTYSMHLMPIQLDMSVSIGSSGAPTIESGSGYGIASITRMATGQYRIQLQDNYSKLLDFKSTMQSPVTGAAVAATALTPGLVYQIVTLGTTTQAQWVTAGVPAGITADVGVVFKAAATSSGTGTAKLLGASGITGCEIMGNNINMLSNQPFVNSLGGFVDFQCMAPTSSSVTTAVATDPASGSKMFIKILLSNSSIQ